MNQTLVFIQKTAVRGGAINRLLDTLHTLQAGTDVRLHVVCSEQGEFTERCMSMGVPLTLHPLPEWRKWRERIRFGAAIKSLAKESNIANLFCNPYIKFLASGLNPLVSASGKDPGVTAS